MQTVTYSFHATVIAAVALVVTQAIHKYNHKRRQPSACTMTIDQPNGHHDQVLMCQDEGKILFFSFSFFFINFRQKKNRF